VASPISKVVQPRDVKELFGKISLSNHYVVNFSELTTPITQHIRKRFGVSDVRSFVSRRAGILCSEASLPTSRLATGEVKDNFMGIPQEFAHTRLYTDLDFTFYVDNDYKNLRIFEGWIDYISSGGEVGENAKSYYRRMRYPDTYKCDTMYITKFERDYKNELVYQFKNAFPKSMTAIPVAYGPAELLKVTVMFNFDRYIMTPRRATGVKKGTQKDNSTVSIGSLAAQESFKQNRDSLINDTSGSNFNFDPSRFGGGGIIQDSNPGSA
tara:strand:+ start:37 stop:840 length:804 start_codon:yes stop_codon:yes gene_type:complete